MGVWWGVQGGKLQGLYGVILREIALTKGQVYNKRWRTSDPVTEPGWGTTGKAHLQSIQGIILSMILLINYNFTCNKTTSITTWIINTTMKKLSLVGRWSRIGITFSRFSLCSVVDEKQEVANHKLIDKLPK